LASNISIWSLRRCTLETTAATSRLVGNSRTHLVDTGSGERDMPFDHLSCELAWLVKSFRQLHAISRRIFPCVQRELERNSSWEVH
jgi:hypothetical protein